MALRTPAEDGPQCRPDIHSDAWNPADSLATITPTVAQFLSAWLAEVVEPSLEPATYAYYETMVRRYIVPGLGSKRLDELQSQDVQSWLDHLPKTCQCCAQAKDAARPETMQRCCAVGACCEDHPGDRTIQAARNTLRAALNHALHSGELVTRNAAAYVQPPTAARQRSSGLAWSVDEASQFLASARDDNDPFYAAYVLIVINGLAKGETLGLIWPSASFDRCDLDTAWQLQRVGKRLIHKPRAKPDDLSADRIVPMPEISAAALKLRRDDQDAAREHAGGRWQASELVFTTRWGTAIEPRNFTRSFDARCRRADVPRIRIRDARRTCAPLLADLGVHPSMARRILRHAKITMTEEAYAKICEETARGEGQTLTGRPSRSSAPLQPDPREQR